MNTRKALIKAVQSLFLVAITFALLIAAHSCKKKEKEQYTITGKLYLRWGDTATAKHYKLTLFSPQGFMLFCNERFDHVYAETDDKGNFSITYTESKCKSELGINIDSATERIIEIPSLYSNRDIHLGNIYLKNNTPTVYKILTDTAYSSTVRLLYEYPHPTIKYNKITKGIYGPFYNNQYIDTIVLSTDLFLDDAPYVRNSKVMYAGEWQLYDTSKKQIIKKGAQYYPSIVHCKNYNEITIKLVK